MSVRSAQSITTEFTTRRFDTGVATNADSLPSGTLYVNGTADAASVTVTNQATGKYKAAVTLPTLAVGDVVSIVIAATVNSITDNAKVWEDTKDFVIDSSGYVSSDIQTIKTQSVTCASGVTVPSQIASPTNITAATGITVSAIGANVITATSIANDAITDAKVAADVTIASITGNVGGNVVGSVGSIASGGITAASIAASSLNGKGDWNIGKTGYSLSQTFPTNFASIGITAGGIVSADIQTIKTQAVDTTGAGTITVPAAATLASTTNITAATGITVSAIGANVITSASIASHAISQGKIDVDNVLEEFMLVPVSGYELEGSWGDYFFETGVSALDAKNNTITLLARITSGLFTGITSMAQWLGLLAGKQVGNTTARTEIRATGAGSGTYDETTDSQEATRDRGDSAWGAGAVPSAGDIADAVWNEAIADHVGAGSTGQALNAVGAAADPWITTLPGSYTAGQAGYIIGGLDDTISSLGIGGGMFSNSFPPGSTIYNKFVSVNGYDLSGHTVAAYRNGAASTQGTVTTISSTATELRYSYAIDAGVYVYGDSIKIECFNVAGQCVAEHTYSVAKATISVADVQQAEEDSTGRIYITRGDTYDGVANAKKEFAVEKDYSGWTGAFTIRHRVTGAVLITTTATVASSVLLTVSLSATNTAFALLVDDTEFGPHPFDIEMTSGARKQQAVSGIVIIAKDVTYT